MLFYDYLEDKKYNIIKFYHTFKLNYIQILDLDYYQILLYISIRTKFNCPHFGYQFKKVSNSGLNLFTGNKLNLN